MKDDPASDNDLGAWLRGDQWQNGESSSCHPSSHYHLAPGGRDYWTQYAFVKGQTPQGATVLDAGGNCEQVIRNLTDDLGCEAWNVDAKFSGLTPTRLAELDMVDRFDVVLALEVIERPLNNMFDFRRNVAWALREGGRLVIMTPHEDCDVNSPDDPGHMRIWSRDLLTRFFGAHDVYVELWGGGGPHIGAAWTPTQIALQRWRCEAL